MNVRRSFAAAALVLTAPALCSCGGSFDAQTNKVYNPSAGVDERSGSVDVLNALIVSGTDGSGTVIASLVNNDRGRDDTLRGVSGAGTDSSVKVTPGGETAIPAGGLLNLATDGTITARGERVTPGNFVEITFSFDRGQPATLKVPVVSADNPAYSDVPSPSSS